MTYYDRIQKICDDNNGVVTSSAVTAEQIPSWYLTDMVAKGRLIREARGIYITPDGIPDEYYFFQLRNGRCIYSYASALYLHGLTDRVPYEKEVTVYKGYNSSHIADGTVIHYVDRGIYELGITEEATVFGNRVKVYDKERTICDLIANRLAIDVEVFSKAIKSYASAGDRDYHKLRRYAKAMKISVETNAILEIL